jgi:hypothetical protein
MPATDNGWGGGRGERRDVKRRAKLLEDYFNTSSLAYTATIPEISSSPTTPFNYSHLATVDRCVWTLSFFFSTHKLSFKSVV